MQLFGKTLTLAKRKKVILLDGPVKTLYQCTRPFERFEIIKASVIEEALENIANNLK
jgi:hypothetical protein